MKLKLQIEKRVLGNAIYLGLGAIVGQTANFGFVILVARGFGREVFAQYSLSMAIGGLTCLLVSFGSLSLITRSASQDQARGLEMVRSVLPVQVLIGISLWIATLGFGLAFTGSMENLAILACIVGHHIIIRLTDVLLTQLYGRERLDIVALVRVGRDVGALALGVTFALTTGSAVAGVLAMPIVGGFFLFYSGFKMRSVVGPIAWKWAPHDAWDVARQAFPFFLIVVVTAACDRLGPLMLTVIQNLDSLATYATGERIITFGATIYTMLTAASFPAASRLALTDEKRQRELAGRIARVVLVVLVPASTLLFLFSSDIIALLFGDEFATSAPVLQIVAWVLVVRGFNSVQAMLAVANSRQRDVLVGRCIGLFLLVALGIPLIAALGPIGLAIATLGVELGYTITLNRLLARANVGLLPIQSFHRILLACAVTLVVGMILADLELGYRIVLVGGCTVVGLWVFGAVRPHDLRYLFAILVTKRIDPTEGI